MARSASSSPARPESPREWPGLAGTSPATTGDIGTPGLPRPRRRTRLRLLQGAGAGLGKAWRRRSRQRPRMRWPSRALRVDGNHNARHPTERIEWAGRAPPARFCKSVRLGGSTVQSKDWRVGLVWQNRSRARIRMGLDNGHDFLNDFSVSQNSDRKGALSASGTKRRTFASSRRAASRRRGGDGAFCRAPRRLIRTR